MLIIVAIGWMFVVVVAAAAEAAAPNGSVLGALFTLFGWGLLPLGIVLYILGTPARRRARRAAEQASAVDEDGAGQVPGDPVPPVRKEP